MLKFHFPYGRAFMKHVIWKAAGWLQFILCFALTLSGGKALAGQVSGIGRDEEIVFFPSFATEVAGTQLWEAELQGCVYEPEKRRLALAVLHPMLERDHFEMTPSQELVFRERTRLFMVDHERGETVVVRLGGETYTLGKSRADGRFSARVRFQADRFGQLSSSPSAVEPQVVRFQAVLTAGDNRVFSGEIYLVKKAGITVVSDIDDTIKVTQVSDHRLMLRNTFMEPFRPVPGMAKLYREWAERDSAQFWYVSASPWQLFAPLSEFVRSNGFPGGVFCLKQVRWKDRSLLSLFAAPAKHKLSVLEPLFKQFPRRRFVLVGDSGEEDPEIYAALARKYPRQVEKIYIRDVTGEAADAARYRRLTNDLPALQFVLLPKDWAPEGRRP
jgi:hypothetical protein